MKTTKRHREIANDIWEGELSQEQIAEKHNTPARTIRDWMQRPEFQALLDEKDEEHRKAAKREATKFAKRATKVLVKLTETQKIKVDENTENERFIYSDETVRKAAGDILEMAEAKPQKVDRGDIEKHKSHDIDTNIENLTIQFIHDYARSSDEELAKRADRIGERLAKIRSRFSQN